MNDQKEEENEDFDDFMKIFVAAHEEREWARYEDEQGGRFVGRKTLTQSCIEEYKL